ncbi:MAG: hypothetical protein GY719_37680 [bacterium]|nr:hypothetical protein [bacterium]
MTLERRVAVLYLAKLLTGATSAEMEGRRVTRIAFQQAPAKPVDDLVIYASRDGEVDPSLELAVAVRRAPDLVTSDTETEKLLTKFLRALRDGEPGDRDFDLRLAICVAGPQTAAQQVEELADLAKHHNVDSFVELLRTPGKSRKELVRRLDHFVNLIKAGLTALGEDASVCAAERAAWELLARLRVLMPRVESPDESDWAELLNQLEPRSRGQTVAAATNLRDRLEALTACYGPKAAVVDLSMLCRDAHDVLDSERRRNARGWAELKRLDRDARDAVRTEMGTGPAPSRLHLPRTAAATALRSLIGEGVCALVYGESGVGKSTLVLSQLSAEVQTDPDRQQFVFLNLRQLPTVISDLRKMIGCSVDEILSEMSAPSRLLVIDAAEYIAETRPDLLSYLVHAAKKADVDVWVITTTEGRGTVQSKVETVLTPMIEHEISPLTDEDLVKMGLAFPQLHDLLANPHSKELLRRPVVADLLVRAGGGHHLLSEADALRVVWEKLVRADGRTDRGTPDARDQVFRSLAGHRLQCGSPNDLYSRLDASAVDGLRRDGLLRSSSADFWQVLPEFSHDLLRTFAVSKVLLADGDPATALLEADAPRWALPAARLAAQVLLAAPETRQRPVAGRLERIQADFDRLDAAGHGQRWSDLPTEAVLPLPHASTVLARAWEQLLKRDAHGLRRALRVIQQRRRRGSFFAPMVAEPVVELLLGKGWPTNLKEKVEELFRDWLQALIIANAPAGHELREKLRGRIVQSVQEGDQRLAEQEAERAAELAARTPQQVREAEEYEKQQRQVFEALTGGFLQQRSASPPRVLTRRSTMRRLALLGLDLGEEGEELLRRVAREAPDCLAPAVEEVFAGRSVASYKPSLLIELIEAYYLVPVLESYNAYAASLFEDGIRDHDPRSWYFAGPLAAYNRGPFFDMFCTVPLTKGAACLNKLLNHAARVRAVMLQYEPGDPNEALVDDQAYGQVLSITGEPRTYVGDSQVWLWYRGTGVGPYPCMSALQALEIACERFVDADVPLSHLAKVLLKDCENLAMPALIVGLLVRHLDKAEATLEPFLTEPLIWRLEFERVAAESSGLAASSEGIHAPERRRWSLLEAARVLVLSAEGDRINELRGLGERLIVRAHQLEGGDESEVTADGGDGPSMSKELAAVHSWAAALDRNSYSVTQHENGFLIQQAVAEDVQQVLEPGNEDLARGQQAFDLMFRYVLKRLNLAGAPDVSLAELQSDLATARELLANPPAAGPSRPFDAPIAVAAGALQLFFIAGESVASEDLAWSAQLLAEVAAFFARAPEQSDFKGSVYPQGADRSAARGVPLLFLPVAAELRAALAASGITQADLALAARWLISRSPDEVRLFYAQAMDPIWQAPCDDANPTACHHSRAIDLLQDSARECVLGGWDVESKKSTIKCLEGPLEDAFEEIAADKIIVLCLSPAIRGLSVAAYTPNCCKDKARALLAALIAAHWRGLAAYKRRYQHRASDTLVAARALLVEVANGKEDLLRAHVKHYIDADGLLAELLRALAASAEENPTAADAARRMWPRLIDQVLNLVEEGRRSCGHRHFGSEALAALIPNLAHETTYLRRELEAEPIDWPDVLAWRRQVKRWLPAAAGNVECVDALVRRLDSHEEADQVAVGLPWIEVLVEGGPGEVASNSWFLPDWLRKLQPHVDGTEHLSSWRRIVDMLVVAGDTRVAEFSD